MKLSRYAFVFLLLSLSFTIFAQAIPDATITAPVSDPVTTISLKRVEANLTLESTYVRLTIGYYRQSGAFDHEEYVAVTDGDSNTAEDDLITGRGPAAGEPIGILAAMGIPVEGESETSVAFAVRKRVMTWVGLHYPNLLTGATIN
jgi:hypothetical protein